jgi:tetratricopeptide (TPR) repeat protein
LGLITEKLIFFIPAIAMGILTIMAQKEAGAIKEDAFGLDKTVLFGFYGIMMYAIKMIVPFNLSPFYPFPPINESLPVSYYIAPVFFLMLSILFFYSYKRNRLISFGIVFYLVNLLLVLQIFSVGSAIIADRYTYIPYIGLFIIAGWAIDRYAKGNIVKANYLIIPITIFFSVLTFTQSGVWKHGAALWDQAIKSQPSSRAYSARASLFKKEGNYNKAIEYYSEAIRMNKIDHESYNNRANIYMDQNKFDLALEDYKKAIAIKPGYHTAFDNIGAMFARKNQLDSALIYLDKALQIKPDYKPAYANRGLVLMNLQRYQEAIKDWEKFLQYEPNDADVINSLGSCYRFIGKLNESLVQINRAIELSQQPPFYLNRSYTYSALNNLEAARNDALTAKRNGVQIDPAYASSLGIQ